MAKQKYQLSKKQEYLIDKLVEIPTIEELTSCNWSKEMLEGKRLDLRYNTEDILLMIIQKITSGTQMESTGREITEKARAVFDYYSEKE